MGWECVVGLQVWLTAAGSSCHGGEARLLLFRCEGRMLLPSPLALCMPSWTCLHLGKISLSI